MIDEEVVREVVAMHAVYRMYNCAGRLLYVGLTSNPGTRLSDHGTKRWFPLVATIKLEWFSTRTEAEAAEAEAIRTEEPQINVAGVPRSVRKVQVRPSYADPTRPVSLVAATGMGLFSTVAAARKAVQRAHLEPVDQDGLRFLYLVGDLAKCQPRKAANR